MSGAVTARGAEIVRIARGWIGTPYLHRTSLRGAGCDCLGLLRGVWREVYGEEPATLPDYRPDWGDYSGDEALMDGLARHLLPDDAGLYPGQVLLFRMRPRAVAKHLGIVSAAGNAPTFIHAYDRHGVVESPLPAPWRRRIAARFRFPD